MPTVEAYGQAKVKTAALPGVRKSSSAETFESAGGTIAQGQEQLARAKAGVGEAVAGLGVQAIRAGGAVLSLADQLAQQERNKQNQIAVLAADRQLADAEYALVNGPNGALTVKGKDTMPLHDAVLQAYDTKADDIGKGLANDEQRVAFQRLRDGRRESIGNAVATHAMRELQQYDADETKGYVDAAHSAAIAYAGDNPRVALELQRGEAAIRGYGDRNQVAKALVDQQVAAFRSGVHVAVIDRMITNEQPAQARIYFEETRDQVQGEQLEHVEKQLAEGSLRKEAQQKADAILAAGGTLTEQRAKAKQIENADLRDAVTDRLDKEAAFRDKAKHDAEEATLRTAYDLVDKYQTVDRIPPAVWTSLSGAARSSLRSYAEHLAKGEPIETDAPTYYTLMQEAANDPKVFIKENLLTLRHKLDDGDWKGLVSLQLSMTNAANKPEVDRQLEGVRTKQEVLKSTLALYGIDADAKVNTPEGKAVAELGRMLDRRVDAVQAPDAKGNHHQASHEEIQQALDGLLSQSVKVPGSWWGLVPFMGVSLSDSSKRLTDLTIDDVPVDVRTTIARKLRGRGLPVTDVTILDTYLESQVK